MWDEVCNFGPPFGGPILFLLSPEVSGMSGTMSIYIYIYIHTVLIKIMLPLKRASHALVSRTSASTREYCKLLTPIRKASNVSLVV